MLDFIKKHIYYISITIVYTFLAALIYGIWSYSAWRLWYLTLIIVIIILAIGSFVGYTWMKSETKKENNTK